MIIVFNTNTFVCSPRIILLSKPRRNLGNTMLVVTRRKVNSDIFLWDLLLTTAQLQHYRRWIRNHWNSLLQVHIPSGIDCTTISAIAYAFFHENAFWQWYMRENLFPSCVFDTLADICSSEKFWECRSISQKIWK